jgi:type II secretory pathway pseudopilin PulG
MAGQHEARRAERGETLIELILTVTILAVGIVALVGGLADGILASDTHRKHSTAGTVANNAAEYLLDSGLAWNASGSYGGLPTASGYTTSLNARCWNGDSPATFAACPNGNRGLQELTITVTATDGKGRETVTVLKRRPNL